MTISTDDDLGDMPEEESCPSPSAHVPTPVFYNPMDAQVARQVRKGGIHVFSHGSHPLKHEVKILGDFTPYRR